MNNINFSNQIPHDYINSWKQIPQRSIDEIDVVDQPTKLNNKPYSDYCNDIEFLLTIIKNEKFTIEGGWKALLDIECLKDIELSKKLCEALIIEDIKHLEHPWVAQQIEHENGVAKHLIQNLSEEVRTIMISKHPELFSYLDLSMKTSISFITKCVNSNSKVLSQLKPPQQKEDFEKYINFIKKILENSKGSYSLLEDLAPEFRENRSLIHMFADILKEENFLQKNILFLNILNDSLRKDIQDIYFLLNKYPKLILFSFHNDQHIEKNDDFICKGHINNNPMHFSYLHPSRKNSISFIAKCVRMRKEVLTQIEPPKEECLFPEYIERISKILIEAFPKLIELFPPEELLMYLHPEFRSHTTLLLMLAEVLQQQLLSLDSIETEGKDFPYLYEFIKTFTELELPNREELFIPKKYYCWESKVDAKDILTEILSKNPELFLYLISKKKSRFIHYWRLRKKKQ